MFLPAPNFFSFSLRHYYPSYLFPFSLFLPPGGYLISSLLFFLLVFFSLYLFLFHAPKKSLLNSSDCIYIIPLPPLPLFPLLHLLHFILSRWTLCRSNINTVPRNRQLTRLPSRQKRTPGQEEQQLPTAITTTTRLLAPHHRIVVIKVCVHATSAGNAR